MMRKKLSGFTMILVLLILGIGCGSAAVSPAALTVPPLQTEVLADGLDHPWGLAMLPDGSLLFTERYGRLSRLTADGIFEVATIPNVRARGEGGLLGLAVDPDFETNGLIYVAYNVEQDIPEVRVTRYELTADFELAAATHIVEGIPAAAGGRHSGTQLAMGEDGVLWIGTGDAAAAENPQDPESLAGKILRVDRNGEPAEGNLESPFDPRIFSFGHRNTQGLILFPEADDGVYGYSAEHGSYRDDEINGLLPGNFGWAPDPPYDERVPMTDLERFPDAVEAAWSSGESTIAVSGLTMLSGAAWGELDGVLAVGVLKDRHVRLIRIEDGEVTGEAKLVAGEFGRIRAVYAAPDGALYFSTDNGSDDRILRVVPAE
ncbi:MAG TPA: PQQ-dependent sugar dehydrogenase [Clostridiaceae bacterium]|nr:PQQ-dependent sugar dehydrogenase [Clostridiaceae bacterium]